MAAQSSRLISIEEAGSEPYATILSYPRVEKEALESRIRQLRELGISELEFSGRLRIGRLSLLGKGVAGVVLAGRSGKDRVALKVRRTDSRRDSVTHEASMLKVANEAKVGPRYYANTTDIISMEFVDCLTLPEWITTLTGMGRRSRLRHTVLDIFQQCFRLDNAELDHGELSRAHKNVVVRSDGPAVILDFESASLERIPHNLTSIAQYFFLGSGFAKKVRRIVGPFDEEKLKSALQEYKSQRSQIAFDAIDQALRLQ